MEWEECKEKYIKKTEKDPDKIKSLVRMAEIRQNSLKQIRRDPHTISIITEQYYEIIKELLTALIIKNGMKSTNHECLITYFETHWGYNYESEKMRELKQVRNKINYEGLIVDKSYLEKNELEFKHIIKILKELI